MRVMPSTALNILMAGVMTPSPTSREMPTNVKSVTPTAERLVFRKGRRRLLRTIVPPSPFDPRLMANQAYSTETRIVRVHMTRERTPITLSCVGFARRKMTVSVYMGLVPMSPNTRPRERISPLTPSCLVSPVCITVHRSRQSGLIRIVTLQTKKMQLFCASGVRLKGKRTLASENSAPIHLLPRRNEAAVIRQRGMSPAFRLRHEKPRHSSP